MTELDPKLSPRFNRIYTEHGQLSILNRPTINLPMTFQSNLLKAEPWYNSGLGSKLAHSSRRVEKHNINGLQIVLKQSRLSGRLVQKMGYPEPFVRQNIPSAQDSLIEKAKSMYQNTYGRELPLEELLGFYIDKHTTERYSIYPYYEALSAQDKNKMDGWRTIQEIGSQLEKYRRELQAIGIYRGESGNYLLVRDSERSEGYRIMFVDTELWYIEKPS